MFYRLLENKVYFYRNKSMLEKMRGTDQGSIEKMENERLKLVLKVLKQRIAEEPGREFAVGVSSRSVAIVETDPETNDIKLGSEERITTAMLNAAHGAPESAQFYIIAGEHLVCYPTYVDLISRSKPQRRVSVASLAEGSADQLLVDALGELAEIEPGKIAVMQDDPSDASGGAVDGFYINPLYSDETDSEDDSEDDNTAAAAGSKKATAEEPIEEASASAAVKSHHFALVLYFTPHVGRAYLAKGVAALVAEENKWGFVSSQQPFQRYMIKREIPGFHGAAHQILKQLAAEDNNYIRTLGGSSDSKASYVLMVEQAGDTTPTFYFSGNVMIKAAGEESFATGLTAAPVQITPAECGGPDAFAELVALLPQPRPKPASTAGAVCRMGHAPGTAQPVKMQDKQQDAAAGPTCG